jgi:acylglycerol lipase
MSDNNSIISIRGTSCYVHCWDGKLSPSTTKPEPGQQQQQPRALVVIFHGFLAHGRYPTVRYAAEFLSDAGYTVISIDFPGHGRSDGLRGFVKSADDLIEDGIEMVSFAINQVKSRSSNCNTKKVRLVLLGSSMGGAIALSVAHRLSSQERKDDFVETDPLVILLAPMLKLNVNAVEHIALQCLSYIFPTAQLIPSSATSAEKQYRDQRKRQECEDDELTVSGSKLRIASALSCVDVTMKLREEFSKISSPYLLLIADEDVVVKNEGAEEFHDASISSDKTKKNYPALHGLLCEPSPLFDEIKKDILDWLDRRV